MNTPEKFMWYITGMTIGFISGMAFGAFLASV